MKKESVRLREVRIKAGLTIQELADAADLGWSQVQAIETGRIPGAFMAKVNLAGALDVDFKKLWPDTYASLSESMRRSFFLTTAKQKEKK